VPIDLWASYSLNRLDFASLRWYEQRCPLLSTGNRNYGRRRGCSTSKRVDRHLTERGNVCGEKVDEEPFQSLIK